MRGNLALLLVPGGRRGSIPAGAGEPTEAGHKLRHCGVYPRGCGGTSCCRVTWGGAAGLSPRVRGNLARTPIATTRPGSIPAGAGEPASRRFCRNIRRVYPRGCGGTRRREEVAPGAEGLSPRVRGNRRAVAVGGRLFGSIPAGAGEPCAASATVRGYRVYPRGCGGTCISAHHPNAPVGLSPRVRGNPKLTARGQRFPGSIPAGAGEPMTMMAPGGDWRVYPRGCGGTASSRACFSVSSGLSPRVRGNHLCGGGARGRDGSIPAGAGEPRGIVGRAGNRRVYPRGCGGTTSPSGSPCPLMGLSPRVRGNPISSRCSTRFAGSIPAGAGEPRDSGNTMLAKRVYPRGCGGTAGTATVSVMPVGLSPRVRGNPHGRIIAQLFRGSIPAGAGEPRADTRLAGLRRVYPRGCGGTRSLIASPPLWLGLSPRVRGNLGDRLLCVHPVGSIPAGAGEPGAGVLGHAAARVYPRGCGGTSRAVANGRSPWGLSPRVRGNRSVRAGSARSAGSIPAGAGEPGFRPAARSRRRVYPRGCGGTGWISRCCASCRGLSPRVRGNRLVGADMQTANGSIPAGAGEPLRRFLGADLLRVYPRGCGGTVRWIPCFCDV